MPEGDTVHLAASRLNAALTGREIMSSEFRVPSLATADLSGRTIGEIVAVGKHLLIRIEPDLTLHTHFRMEGAWHLYRAGSPRRGPDHEIRAILETEPWTAVGFRLPVIELLERSSETEVVGHLGPDPLGDSWDAALAVSNLMEEPDRPIGSALLDQRAIAGPGNIYRSEICFLAGVHPSTAVRASPVEKVVDLVFRTMVANRTTGSQITTGDTRPGRKHWVYGRWKKPCRRCRTPIERTMMDGPGGERAVFWCPSCQPQGDLGSGADQE